MILLSLTWWFWIPALMAAGLLCVGGWKGRSRILMLLFFLFVVLGMIRGTYEKRRWEDRVAIVSRLAEEYVEMEGLIEDISFDKGKVSITLLKNRVGKERIPCVLVSFQGGVNERKLRIGRKVLVKGKIKSFEKGRNPGEFDSEAYYHAEGVDCRLYGECLTVIDYRISPLPDLLYRIREHGKKVLDRIAAPEDAGIFCAAILGDKKGISAEVKDLYQKNGIAHLLAISGLHLSLIGLGLYRLLRRVGVGYGMSGIFGTCFICCYGMMTGGSASVIRAVTMMMAAFLASYLGKTYDLVSAACLALVLLAWKSPGLLFQGGVQLSFGAVLAIGAAAPKLIGWLGKENPWSGTVGISLAIQLVTVPMVLYHFFQYPLYGIFLNLLVIPLMGFVIGSGIGGIFFGSFSLFCGIIAIGAGHFVLRFYEWICNAVSGLPYHNLIIGRPEIRSILLYYLILTVGLVVAEQLERKEQDRFAIRLISLMVFCLLSFSILIPPPISGLEVVFLDVGQGDGILLQTAKETVLIDGGSTSEKLLGQYRLEPCLKSYGISNIDYIFISHSDQDHLSGIQYLLESVPDIKVGRILLPYHGREDEAIITLAALAARRGATVSYLAAGDSIDNHRGLKITCLYPGISDIPSDINEESEVLKVDYGDCHMLFTGDMSGSGEKQLLQDISGLNIQILKVAHHGSRYSTTDTFLDTLKPRYAVISYGEENSYGHPHKEVLERLREHKVKTWKTGESGAIIMNTDGKRVRWRQFLEEDQDEN